jgi:hypothetical protein
VWIDADECPDECPEYEHDINHCQGIISKPELYWGKDKIKKEIEYKRNEYASRELP